MYITFSLTANNLQHEDFYKYIDKYINGMMQLLACRSKSIEAIKLQFKQSTWLTVEKDCLSMGKLTLT